MPRGFSTGGYFALRRASKNSCHCLRLLSAKTLCTTKGSLANKVLTSFSSSASTRTREPVPSLKGPPIITVPFAKSRSINAACSDQYACSRTVLPGVQAAPGAHRITKVFFMHFLFQFIFRNQSLNLCQRFSHLQTESSVNK